MALFTSFDSNRVISIGFAKAAPFGLDGVNNYPVSRRELFIRYGEPPNSL